MLLDALPPRLGGALRRVVAPGAAGRRSHLAVWAAFVIVHAWLTLVGVVIAPRESFWDIDLYEWWMFQATHDGVWPVLDGPWVYPVGAIVPMLLPALASTTNVTAYVTAWCALVTVLDGVAVAWLLRRGRPGALGAAWWLAYLAALGPVAMGRLDAVAAPLMIVGLLAAARRPRVAAVVLTVGAWIKVAPGALVLPLFTAARRPLRDVVAPAATVCAAVATATTALGGLPHLLSFLSAQEGRGLQVEAVAATPWVLMHAARNPDVGVVLNQHLVTWEIAGPGTAATARVLNVGLALAAGAVAALLWWASRRGAASAVLAPGALLVLTVLVTFDKVLSPQYLSWLAAPVAVALAARPADDGRRPRWLRAAAPLLLVVAGLTQWEFPWAYQDMLVGAPAVSIGLALRNVLLVVVLGVAVAGVVRAARMHPDDPSGPPDDAGASRAGRTASGEVPDDVPADVPEDLSDEDLPDDDLTGVGR